MTKSAEGSESRAPAFSSGEASRPAARVENAVTHLFLVRHGETDYNKQGIVQGRGIDVPLNELGRRQARALASHAATFNLDVIYASTLIRAKQTAQTVALENQDKPLIYLNDLEEMSWGDYEGMHVTDALRDEFVRMREEWQQGNYTFSIGRGESALDVQQRALRGINYIIDNHAGERVMVVAHGRFLRILIASLLDAYGLQRMEEIKHANTGINYITHSAAGFEMQYLNNTDHLASLS
ncbi:MAG: histidine phosphatase family protein [Bacteroidota bacterium]